MSSSLVICNTVTELSMLDCCRAGWRGRTSVGRRLTGLRLPPRPGPFLSIIPRESALWPRIQFAHDKKRSTKYHLFGMVSNGESRLQLAVVTRHDCVSMRSSVLSSSQTENALETAMSIRTLTRPRFGISGCSRGMAGSGQASSSSE